MLRTGFLPLHILYLMVDDRHVCGFVCFLELLVSVLSFTFAFLICFHLHRIFFALWSSAWFFFSGFLMMTYCMISFSALSLSV